MRFGVELDWLEDFIEFIATRNFSTAAASRNISQSAFSRRIKALEAWLGADLIDRSTYPARLTGAGNLFVPRAEELVRSMYQVRAECRNLSGVDVSPLSFSALHTLAIYFFPRWLKALSQSPDPTHCTMQAGDFLDSIEQLTARKCDFALVYDHPGSLPVLQSGPFESVQVGTDRLVLVSGCDANGRPIYSVDGDEFDKPIPYLAYAWSDGYLGKLISLIQSRRSPELPLSTVYQSSLAEAIKQMAIVGTGIAWLPLICVRDAIANGELAQIGGSQMTMEIQIRLFRRTGRQNPAVEAFWEQLNAAKGDRQRSVPIRP